MRPAFSFPPFLCPSALPRPYAERRLEFLSFEFAAARRFVHSWLTLAQQGLFLTSLVLLSLLGSKKRTRGHTEPSSFFCSKNESAPPPLGGGADSFFLGSSSLPYSFTTGSHGSNRSCLGNRWYPSPPRPLIGHKSPHRGEFGSHRFFFVRLCSDWAAKSRPSL